MVGKMKKAKSPAPGTSSQATGLSFKDGVKFGKVFEETFPETVRALAGPD